MRAWISRIVDVRPGEGVALAQAFFTLFGLIAAHTILETARDALFLTKLPVNRLTIVYAALAALALVGAALNARLVRAFGRRNALVLTLLVAAYGTTILHFREQTPTNIFILYLWSGFLGTVMVIQFWMFAGQLFNGAREGKRLFGPIASGGVLGAVAGASLAAIVLKMIPVSTLLLVSAGLFIATAVLLTTVGHEELKVPASAPVSASPLDLAPIALLKKQPYLARLALLSALATGAVLATDYMFKAGLADWTKVQGHDLGPFLAKYYAILNAVALVVQVGLAERIVRKQGVFFVSIILPSLLLFGASGVLVIGGGIAVVLMTKGADGSLRHSLHRVASELLWMPVPHEARDGGKAFIDGVVTRGSSALVAGLILLLSTFGLSSPRVLALLVVVLVIAWLATATSVRGPYLDLIRQALRKGTFIDDDMPNELDLDSVEAVLESLSSRDASRVIAAMDLLSERKRSRLIPALVLYHESDDVLVRALEIVSEPPKGNAPAREDWLPLAERLATNGSERVRVAVIRAYVAQNRIERVRAALKDPSPSVRAHAAFCMAHCDETKNPVDDPEIKAMLALEGEQGTAARLALLDAIRDHGDVRFADLVMKMNECDDDPELVERAAMTMGKLADPRFIPMLIQRLTMRNGRASVREALVAHGEPALDALERALFDASTDPRIMLHLPRTISRFRSQDATDILMRALTREPNGQVRYKVLRGLGRLIFEQDFKIDRLVIDGEIRKNLVEHLRMMSMRVPLDSGKSTLDPDIQDSAEMVIGLVGDKERHALERAFRLMQIKHRREDIRTVFMALDSKEKRLRSSAQEFVDVVTLPKDRNNRLELENRELWRIITDDLPDGDRVQRADGFLPGRPKTYSAALSRLVRESDEYLASLASYHALEIGADDLRDEVIEVYEQRPSLRTILQQATQVPRFALGGV